MRERLLDPVSPIYECLRPEPVGALVKRHGSAAADMSPQSWLRQEKGWGALH